ncbi:GNAT family N-acetyltransferase [Streptomyces sp. ODS28]|uniref:GNAT family N-acetyltransferase n=1 Tax=Streptomyces sp. ODS28 TaxID=3136688 RepID=UPI0031E7F5D7
MKTHVTPVRGRAELTAFLRLSQRLYRDDPYWVAPLEREQRMLLNPRRNPFFDTGSARLFLARRGTGRGAPVLGRIAVARDPRFVDEEGAPYGVFGFFECAEDITVAAALFEAAEEWLADSGAATLRGPLGFTTNEECGLLVDGFAHAPTLMTAYNPPSYPGLLEGCGFTKAKDLYSWLLHAEPEGRLPERIGRLADAVRRLEGVTVRPLDPADFGREAARIRDIYNRAWARNWGAVTMSDREFAHLAARLKPLVRRGLALFAEVDGEPVAFALGVPDLNQALRPVRGRLTTWGLPLGLLRLVRGMRRIDTGRLVALGVQHEFRGRGLETVLYTELQRLALERGFRRYELSWTLEDNTSVNRAIEAAGGSVYRTHRIYRRPIPAQRAASAAPAPVQS